MKRPSAAMRIWRWPALFFVLITAGLFSALLGQTGAWIALSWFMLALPVIVIAIAMFRSRVGKSY